MVQEMKSILDGVERGTLDSIRKYQEEIYSIKSEMYPLKEKINLQIKDILLDMIKENQEMTEVEKNISISILNLPSWESSEKPEKPLLIGLIRRSLIIWSSKEGDKYDKSWALVKKNDLDAVREQAGYEKPLDFFIMKCTVQIMRSWEKRASFVQGETQIDYEGMLSEVPFRFKGTGFIDAELRDMVVFYFKLEEPR